MYLIGLTGGIASGKSAIAGRLAEHGAIVVDADVLAREVVEPGTQGLAEFARQFGPGVIAPDGSLDRAALGAIVFPDPDKRALLNSITHPAIWARAKQLFELAQERDPHAVVVYDVPLLAEASSDRPMRFDLVVVVHADLLEAMSSQFGFRLAPGFGERVIFRELFLKGMTLLDLKEDPEHKMTLSALSARQEVRELLRCIAPETYKGYPQKPHISYPNS